MADPKEQKIIDLGGAFMEEMNELETKFNIVKKENYWTIQKK